MTMEEGTLPLLHIGFGTVIALCAFVFIVLWRRTRLGSYIWFLANLVFLVIGYFFAVDVLKGNPDVHHVMRSEENSWSIGLAGVSWALSVFCMLIGVCEITNRLDRDR
ncbi:MULTISPECIES: hypothetical protein [Paenibacillus]|uniref:hypothetical protein n=1 Tax=Paenibacillus TaxID=44249 RepID=UPI0022B916F7|nr:hypothetical protein [Paenibacillus caseinilyticus]MCZ8521815.1 hypothetical protein [Paenibacillus caseinilyticus]